MSRCLIRSYFITSSALKSYCTPSFPCIFHSLHFPFLAFAAVHNLDDDVLRGSVVTADDTNRPVLTELLKRQHLSSLPFLRRKVHTKPDFNAYPTVRARSRSQFCFTIVYLYCMVAVCQPVIKLMIDWLIDWLLLPTAVLSARLPVCRSYALVITLKPFKISKLYILHRTMERCF